MLGISSSRDPGRGAALRVGLAGTRTPIPCSPHSHLSTAPGVPGWHFCCVPTPLQVPNRTGSLFPSRPALTHRFEAPHGLGDPGQGSVTVRGPRQCRTVTPAPCRCHRGGTHCLEVTPETKSHLRGTLSHESAAKLRAPRPISCFRRNPRRSFPSALLPRHRHRRQQRAPAARLPHPKRSRRNFSGGAGACSDGCPAAPGYTERAPSPLPAVPPGTDHSGTSPWTAGCCSRHLPGTPGTHIKTW